MKRTIYFHECEHHGDMNNYTDDLYDCGATIEASQIDTDTETGIVIIEVEDDKWDSFIEKFSDTDSYGFSSLNRS